MFFDLISTLISLLSTYYFIRLDNRAWSAGLVATCLNAWLYWNKGIYADMLLEFFYFLSMGYGWYKWRKSAKSHQKSYVPLGHLTRAEWCALFLLLGFVFILIHYLLQTFTPSTVPILDAATTSLSLVAQWLMCHKIIVTWILWFITDAIYLVLYFSKSLPFHSVLMLIYTFLAVTGYMLWARESLKCHNPKFGS